MTDETTIETQRAARRSAEHAAGGSAAVPARPHVGLVIPGSRGLDTAHGLGVWLLASAERPDVAVDVADLDRGGDRDRDGYVLLVGQYGPEPAPAVADLVTRFAARWAGRPVGLVAYGGVSRGRDAAATVRRMLGDLDAVVVDACLGVNVAALRGAGPTVFECLGWEMVLDDVARACVRPAAAP